MKKMLFIALLISIMGTGVANAQTESKKGAFVEGGFSMLFVKPSDRSSMDFYGMVIGGGFYTSQHSRLSLDVGITFHGGDEIGRFSYTRPGSSTIHRDGKITRDYVAVPILATWAYEFDIKEKFHVRIGPSLGGSILSASDNYEPEVSNRPDDDSSTKAMFSYGGHVGGSWDISQRATVSLGYRFLGNTDVTIDDTKFKSTANQINISFIWRF